MFVADIHPTVSCIMFGVFVGPLSGAILSLPSRLLAPSQRAVGFGVFFTCFLLFVRVLPSIAIAEVKLILKGSSEQSKRQLIAEGHQDPTQVDFYVNALRKFDSVDMTEYEKV